MPELDDSIDIKTLPNAVLAQLSESLLKKALPEERIEEIRLLRKPCTRQAKYMEDHPEENHTKLNAVEKSKKKFPTTNSIEGVVARLYEALLLPPDKVTPYTKAKIRNLERHLRRLETIRSRK